MGCGCNKVPKSPAKQRSDKKAMPFSLVDRNTVPHGGFKFFEARTRTWMTSATLWYLAELVIKHRKANGLPFGTMDETMAECEAQLCETAPPTICRDKEGIVKMSGVALD